MFEPQNPVKILQKGKQPESEVAKQTPKEIEINRDFWDDNYGRPNYRNGYQMWYADKNRNWGQRNGYGRRYGNGNKNQQRRAHGGSATQTQTYYTTPKGRVSYRNAPSRRIGGGQEDGNGDGEDKNRRRYRDTKYDFEEKDKEESDTEDSFEFEITPQQLSQVTPGGGVLKLTLSRKGPLRITTEALNKRPDSSQTTIKTAYDPTNEKAPFQGGENIKVKTTFRKGESFEDQRIKPTETPNDKRDDSFPEDGGPIRKINPGGNGNSGGNGGPDKGRKPPRKGEEPQNGFRRMNGGGGGSDPSDDDGDGGGSTPPSSESTPPTRRKHRRPKFVYVLQGPPGPPGQVGQPGQAGRDGRDGQAPQLTKALEDALKTQKTSWDTTNLENSFDYFGRTMHEVLKAQQRTSQNLEEQFRRANETQEFQTEAMQDMANANFQMKFDHMFASVPMYDGSNPDTFDDWLYQIESLCEMSHMDIRIELMGRASVQVKHIIRSIPVDIEWEVAHRELKRCLTEEKSRAHSAFKLVQIKQKPNENLRIFILRYQDLYVAATGKTAAEDTDPTHIIRFLGMMTNSEIARKITQKGIPEGMTLGQAFTRAIELEAGYQLSEGASLARPTEIMQVQEVEEVDEIGLGQKRFGDVVCWQCGEKGHLQHDCPHKEADEQIEGMDDPNAGRSEQIIRINKPITVATRDNIYKQMRSQRTKANLYKAGYRKTRAALQEQQKINAAIASTLAAQRAVQAPTMQQTVAQTPVVQQQPVQTSAQYQPHQDPQFQQMYKLHKGMSGTLNSLQE